MNNKEAIAILENLKIQGKAFFSRRLALDLAIKALEERPQGDLISRTWLKEHKFTTQVCNGVEIEDVDVVAVATIDNALTVKEIYKEKYDQLKEAYSLLAEAYEHEVTKKGDT